MSEPGVSPRDRALHFAGRFIRLLLVAAIYALVLWYGVAAAAHLDTPPIPTKVAVVLIAIGITGGIYRFLVDAAKEAKGAIMVIADFLNTHLVEPRKRRLHERGRAEGLAEGRAEARAEVIADIRARLLQEGIDPDRILPLEEAGDKDCG